MENYQPKSHQYWNKDEIGYLIANYSDMDRKELEINLNRNWTQIENKGRRLGLKRSKKFRVGRREAVKSVEWTREESDFLSQNYTENYELVFKTIKKTKKQIQKKASYMGLKTNKKNCNINKCNIYDISKFIDKINPEVAYFLGFLWADGHVRKDTNGLSLSIKRTDALEIKDLMFSILPWRTCICKKRDQLKFNTSSRDLKNLLKSLNYLNKSGGSASEVLCYIPTDLHHYWWRGYFDGDGCISLQKGLEYPIIYITSTFDQNWDFFEDLCSELNLEFKFEKCISKSGNKSSRVYICGTLKAIKFLDFIYQGDIFGLSRKRNKYLKVLGNLENGKYPNILKIKRDYFLDSLSCFPEEVSVAKENHEL